MSWQGPEDDRGPAGRSRRGGDRIEIRDVRALGVHGMLPEERERSQPFALDLDVWLDVRPAGASDDLADTVDYGALVETAVGVVVDRRFQLLEALADAVARGLLAADKRVTRVAVTVRKLRPPIPFDVGSVGIRVSRARTGGSPDGPGTSDGPGESASGG